MVDINLSFCKNILVMQNNRKTKYLLFILILASIGILIRDGISTLDLVMGSLVLAATAFVIFWQSRQNKLLKNNKFYIVEDVFINVKRKKSFNKYTRREQYCTIKFSRNGEYNIVVSKNTERFNIDSDYGAVNFSKPGDKFYLLMLDNGKNKIFKCFNANQYKICEDEFELVDSKYYPKVNL